MHGIQSRCTFSLFAHSLRARLALPVAQLKGILIMATKNKMLHLQYAAEENYYYPSEGHNNLVALNIHKLQTAAIGW